MLKAVTVTNFKGESLRMELSKPEETGLLIYNITGLGSPVAAINSTEMATVDGARFNSARAQTRNIVLTLALVDQIGTSSGGGDYDPGTGNESSSEIGAIKIDLENMKERVSKLEVDMPYPITLSELADIVKGSGIDV